MVYTTEGRIGSFVQPVSHGATVNCDAMITVTSFGTTACGRPLVTPGDGNDDTRLLIPTCLMSALAIGGTADFMPESVKAHAQ
jgi:hypothetical protein